MSDTVIYDIGKRDATAELFAKIREGGMLNALYDLANKNDNVHTAWFMEKVRDKTLQQFLFKGAAHV